MEERKFQQLCIACNKMQSSNQTSCECGHVLREAVTLQRENTRKRKAPFRPNSVSSEWIGLPQKLTPRFIAKKLKQFDDMTDVKDKNNNIIKKNRKRNRHKSVSLDQENKLCLKKKNKAERAQMQQVLDLVDNSYQNIYFNRCKSYRKAKITDFDFEFDFSTFESHNPYYPTALEDINTKINRTNSFWKTVGQ